jgi:hypothetical protein
MMALDKAEDCKSLAQTTKEVQKQNQAEPNKQIA